MAMVSSIVPISPGSHSTRAYFNLTGVTTRSIAYSMSTSTTLSVTSLNFCLVTCHGELNRNLKKKSEIMYEVFKFRIY